MSFEEEAKLLEPFLNQSETGQIVVANEIKAAYEKAVGHTIGGGQIYCVLRRHNWRKIMLRSKHPKKASDEGSAFSKKLTPNATEMNLSTKTVGCLSYHNIYYRAEIPGSSRSFYTPCANW